jgi:hypothetical protein
MLNTESLRNVAVVLPVDAMCSWGQTKFLNVGVLFCIDATWWRWQLRNVGILSRFNVADNTRRVHWIYSPWERYILLYDRPVNLCLDSDYRLVNLEYLTGEVTFWLVPQRYGLWWPLLVFADPRQVLDVGVYIGRILLPPVIGRKVYGLTSVPNHCWRLMYLTLL